MPMMRRGPLDRYPVEWVLRQASAHQASGSIELNVARPLTIYLRAGRVYQVVAGVPTGNAQPHVEGDHHDEAASRVRVVALISAALASEGGWYYHDPLGRHDERGPWQWDVNGLLLDARVRAHEDRSLADWSDAEVALATRGTAAPVVLAPEAWAVVVALAAAVPAAELRTRLGWATDRLVAALDDLEAAGALAPRASRTATGAPVAGGAPGDPIAPEAPGTRQVDAVATAVATPEAARPGLRSTPAAAGAPVLGGERPAAPAYALAGRGTSGSAAATTALPGDPARAASLAPRPRPVGGGHLGPVDGPGDDRRSALRRLISSLRPT